MDLLLILWPRSIDLVLLIMGLKSFTYSKMSSLNLRTEGGLMGFKILPFEPEDEETYDTFTITCPDKLRLSKFAKQNDSEKSYYYDPSDDKAMEADYPAMLNHLSLMDIKDTDNNHLNDLSNDHDCHNDQFDMT